LKKFPSNSPENFTEWGEMGIVRRHIGQRFFILQAYEAGIGIFA
jgi:hypothetical protein